MSDLTQLIERIEQLMARRAVNDEITVTIVKALRAIEGELNRKASI